MSIIDEIRNGKQDESASPEPNDIEISGRDVIADSQTEQEAESEASTLKKTSDPKSETELLIEASNMKVAAAEDKLNNSVNTYFLQFEFVFFCHLFYNRIYFLTGVDRHSRGASQSNNFR